MRWLKPKTEILIEMKFRILFIAALFISTLSYGQKSDSSWIDLRAIKPLSILQLVKGEIKNLNFITVINDIPDNWVTKNDLDSLMKLISSKEKCKCAVSVFYSYLPTTESSDLGGYAILLIKSFKEKKKSNIGLHICPKTNDDEVDILNKWWLDFNK